VAFKINPNQRPGGDDRSATLDLPSLDLQVKELREIRGADQSRLLDAIALIYHAHWKAGTEGYHSERAARRQLERRLDTGRAATFIALTARGELTGTAAIGSDDFYDGFCRSNGIDGCWVGRDLYALPAFRGVTLNGLKVWQHLLQARLRWLGARGQSTMAVFTEPGPIDLPTLYVRLGAVVARRGLHHRHLGRGTITMLEYPVERTLDVLASLQCGSMATVRGRLQAARQPVRSGVHA
jgi:hypothetical protein